MTQAGSNRTRDGQDRKSSRPRLRGVVELAPCHGEPRFRATISRGKGRQVNLGLYADAWLAAFAYNAAVEAIRGDLRTRNEIPERQQPRADQVRSITARVRVRLGLDRPARLAEAAPSADQLLTLLEITVAGFWRGQVATHVADLNRELAVAARRLVESARLVLWSPSSGHPSAREALASLLARRLDQVFRRSDVTRAVLDDEGDDEIRLARWLVYPDELPGRGGFREMIEHLYLDEERRDSNRSSEAGQPGWAVILGLTPPFCRDQIRSAYRARSKSVHPDIGGDHDEFIRLQAAYEEALRHCTTREPFS